MALQCDNAECPENGLVKSSWEVPEEEVVICGVCCVPVTHLPDRPEDDPRSGQEPTATPKSPVEDWMGRGPPATVNLSEEVR